VLSLKIVKVPSYKVNAIAEFFCVFTLIIQVVRALFDTLDY
jgi:hypothetical protein